MQNNKEDTKGIQRNVRHLQKDAKQPQATLLSCVSFSMGGFTWLCPGARSIIIHPCKMSVTLFMKKKSVNLNSSTNDCICEPFFVSPFQTWGAIVLPLNVSFVSGQLGPATKHQLFPIGRISFSQPRPWPIRGQLGGNRVCSPWQPLHSTSAHWQSSHRPPCLRQMDKITPTGEVKLAFPTVWSKP